MKQQSREVVQTVSPEFNSAAHSVICGWGLEGVENNLKRALQKNSGSCFFFFLWEEGSNFLYIC